MTAYFRRAGTLEDSKDIRYIIVRVYHKQTAWLPNCPHGNDIATLKAREEISCFGTYLKKKRPCWKNGTEVLIGLKVVVKNTFICSNVFCFRSTVEHR